MTWGYEWKQDDGVTERSVSISGFPTEKAAKRAGMLLIYRKGWKRPRWWQIVWWLRLWLSA